MEGEREISSCSVSLQTLRSVHAGGCIALSFLVSRVDFLFLFCCVVFAVLGIEPNLPLAGQVLYH